MVVGFYHVVVEEAMAIDVFDVFIMNRGDWDNWLIWIELLAKFQFGACFLYEFRGKCMILDRRVGWLNLISDCIEFSRCCFDFLWMLRVLNIVLGFVISLLIFSLLGIFLSCIYGDCIVIDFFDRLCVHRWRKPQLGWQMGWLEWRRKGIHLTLLKKLDSHQVHQFRIVVAMLTHQDLVIVVGKFLRLLLLDLNAALKWIDYVLIYGFQSWCKSSKTSSSVSN